MYIAIAGNIGSGKTTLTNMLAKHYDWQAKMEPVVDNPYLEDFYKDIKRWSFAMEVYFLKQRFKDMLDISQSSKTIVIDRSIFEGVHVFTKGNHEMGNLSDRDFQTYMDLFEQMVSMLEMPRLMIYLKSSVPHLIHNIQKRGRTYEQSMQIDYLKGLNQRYEDFIKNHYKGEVLVIDVDDLDFEHSTEDFASIISKINERLTPRFL
ncbi:MAG: deoxynucleoside kinase [Bacteroidaceae bacterium]|nr:deoxynucleoside kinase [Bacteroidaceae bacterium]